ncbi:SDR family NAD(P)-dependent oxidoreductase [Microbulbifer halophilus]|uniref:SDR family NAD(P)-dependent oxidoreductase n=1 Tax=Microbulbifer halophilus TaxID=453963 RepID=A0ABW5E6D5_9GAMM|nr:SDR family oxidoreductase [Microbulbifer halophilus]MCW8127274.1 SDR family oxidoreductase [Microbulbifer halophilus]
MSRQRRNFLKLGAATLGTAATSSIPSVAQGNSGDKSNGRFAGKVVAITGATSGIGAAAARLFAAEGARVTFCGRRQKLGEQVAKSIHRAGGEARYIRADVTRPEQVEMFIRETVDSYGRLDIAFNNAGEVTFKPLHQIGLEEWEWIHNTNLRGVFLAMKYEIPEILKAGGGNIVITSSQHAYSTRPGGAAYASSKRALEALAQSASQDYAERGLRVNVVAPGITDTPMFRRATGRDEEAVERANNIVRGVKRIAEPEEIARVALWLASDEASYVTGTTVLADGGLLTGFA